LLVISLGGKTPPFFNQKGEGKSFLLELKGAGRPPIGKDPLRQASMA